MSATLAMTDSDFPGYREAVDRENLIRTAAVLGLGETIAGCAVMPLTFRRVRWLIFLKSPFLVQGITAEQLFILPEIDADILRMLWVISPEFKPMAPRRFKRFIRQNAGRIDGKIKIFIEELLNYVADSYLDAPAPAPSSPRNSYYTQEIDVVNFLHKEFGLATDFWETGWLRNWYRRLTGKPSALDVPLKIIWQLHRAIKHSIDPDASMSNASCKKLSEGLIAINQRAQAAHAKLNARNTKPSSN